MAEAASLNAECARLEAKCAQLLKEEQEINAQMSALQMQLKHLRHKGKTLQQSSAHNATAITSTLKEYAKIACRKLCQDVYNIFPREVRDLIYGHMHTHTKVRINSCWGEPSCCFYSDSESEGDWDDKSCIHVDPWWNVDTIGTYMLHEICEHYYRTALFRFGANYTCIPTFRITDQWNLGFIPVQAALNLEVTIRCEDYNFESLKRISNEGNDATNSSAWGGFRSSSHTSKLLSDIELLFGFCQGTKITIRVWASRVLEGSLLKKQEWMIDTILPLIFPTLKRFEAAGYKVRVILSRKEWHLSSHDFTLADTTLTPEEIKERFEKFKIVEEKRKQQQLEDAESDETFDSISDED